jgi:hypothetical protein
MDRANIGVVESGCCTRFATETFQGVRVLGKVSGEKLECHESPKFGVLGLVHYTHPAAAQLLDDAVMRDGLADHAREESTKGVIVGQLWTASQ